MFPRNVIFFRFKASSIEDIEAALQMCSIRDPGPQELATAGFSSPYGRNDDRRVIRHRQVLGFTFEERVRDLSNRAVNAELDQRIQKIVDEEDRKVGARERRRIRDDILNELLPRAVILRAITRGWIDSSAGRVVIDARTRRRAENVISALRHAFGTFPAVPALGKEDPRTLMTSWLADAAPPKELTLGDECELREPSGANGSLVRCRRQDLDTEEIREHLRSSKQCFALGLVYADRLNLVLADDLSIRALRPTDLLQEEALGMSHESQDGTTEAMFALAVLEVNQLLDFLEQTFAIAREC